jgi:hypothetical protein
MCFSNAPCYCSRTIVQHEAKDDMTVDDILERLSFTGPEPNPCEPRECELPAHYISRSIVIMHSYMDVLSQIALGF